ncbi:MAG: hypothetical protein ACRDF4_11120, partial [Rhabdochlamydiaceae bacterium]
SLKSMSIDVVANATKITDPSQIQAIIDGYLGSHLNQAGFSDKVTLVKFDATAQAAAQKATQVAASQQRIQEIISVLPIIALIAIGFMVMKQISKFSTSSPQLALAGGAGALPMGAVNMHNPDGSPSLDGQSSSPESLQSAVRAAAAQTSDEPLAIDVGNIETKINVPLEQIKKMSDKRPEAVAMLLKGWVMEERN